MTLDPLALEQQKQALRQEMLAKRQTSPKEAVDATTQLRMNLKVPQGSIAAAYMAVNGELDAGPAMGFFFTVGATTCLPVTQGKDQPLLFRQWTIGRPLIDGPYGIPVPPEDHELLTPNIVVVPLVAADKDGYRLGYGGGYYDRTLAALKAQGEVLVIGLAADNQIVEAVPHADHDVPLDILVTPTKYLTFDR